MSGGTLGGAAGGSYNPQSGYPYQGNYIQPFTPTKAIWTWDTSSNTKPFVINYPNGTPTKTGLLPNDLKTYAGVPFKQLTPDNPVDLTNTTLLRWIRWAEDWVEQNTNVLLCPTWVAAPPVRPPAMASQVGIVPEGSGSQLQVLGQDYDLYDAGYDFMFERAQDEGWLYQQLRYTPIRTQTIDGPGNALQNYAMIYPLLNEYFRIPVTWFVEDHDCALIRIVPAANVQMLPLFAMEIAFMGFAESIPMGIWLQYVAGLAEWDYQTRFSFMKELVLTQATITALQSLQGSINVGIKEIYTEVDGMRTIQRYDDKGPYMGLITQFTKRRDEYLKMVRQIIGGPQIINF